MTELWDLVASSQKQQQKLSDQVKELDDACKSSDHGARHLLECESCYSKLVDLMRSRYLDSTEEEWFSGRKAFLREIDRMFTDVKDFKITLQDVEARIIKERDQWLRLRIKASTTIPILAETSMSQAEFKAKLLDPSVEPQKLLEELLSSGPAQQLRTDNAEVLQKVLESPEDRSRSLKQLIIPAELAEKTDVTDISSQLDDEVPISTVFKTILSKRETASRKGNDVRKWQKRLDELRRARAAHHAQQKRKSDARQGGPPRPELLQKPVRCETCSKELEPVDTSLVCRPCLFLVEAHVRNKAAVYCSRECAEKGQDEHCAEAHQCVSNGTCVQGSEGQDVVMGGVDDEPVLCKECTQTLKKEALFCSRDCAGANFQRHREEVHVPMRKEKDLKVDDSEAMVFDNDDRTQYHAKDIAEQVMGFDDENIATGEGANSEIRVKT